MKHTILTLPKTGLGNEATPTVPGATDVSRETGGLFIAYGPFVRGTNTKWSRGPGQVVACLKEWKAGEFIVVGEQTALDEIDPTNKGVTADKMPVEFDATEHGGVIGGVSLWDAMGVEPPEPDVVIEEILEP
jgi:hypothetical protein